MHANSWPNCHKYIRCLRNDFNFINSMFNKTIIRYISYNFYQPEYNMDFLNIGMNSSNAADSFYKGYIDSKSS